MSKRKATAVDDNRASLLDTVDELVQKPYTKKRGEQIAALVQQMPSGTSDEPFVYIAWVHSGNRRRLHTHIAANTRAEAVASVCTMIKSEHFDGGVDAVTIEIEPINSTDRFKSHIASLATDRTTMPSRD
jgi:hypothetical protein